MLRTRHQVARWKPLMPGPAGTRSGVLHEAITGDTGVGMLLARALLV